MQSVLLSSRPPSNKAARATEIFLPSVFQLEHGLLYPRWMMLSVILTILVGIITYFIPIPCLPGNTGFLGFYCQVNKGTLTLQMLFIMGIFLVFWLCSFLFGFLSIEYFHQIGQKRGNVSSFLNAISDVETIRFFLGTLVIPLLFFTIAMCLFNKIEAFPLALAVITMLTVLWTLCYQLFSTKMSTKWQDPKKPTWLYLFRCLPPIRWFKIRERKKFNPGITVATYRRNKS